MRPGEKIFLALCSAKPYDEYAQSIMTLYSQIGDEILDWLEKADAAGKKVVYRDDLHSEEQQAILDYFDERLIRLE